jgi:hypothetical protein
MHKIGVPLAVATAATPHLCESKYLNPFRNFPSKAQFHTTFLNLS